MKNKLISWALALVLALAVCASLLVPAFAAAPGSITVKAQVERDGKSVSLQGDTWSLVKLSSADLPSGWNGLSASEKQAAANKLAAKHDKADDYDAAGKTDADGTLVFAELSSGTYLLSRTGVAAANKDYTCYPCIVPLPMTDPETGAATWDVELVPKHEYIGEPTTRSPDQPTVPDPNNPTTTTTRVGQTTTTGKSPTTTTRAGTTTTTKASVVTRITQYVNTDSAYSLTVAMVITGVAAAAILLIVLAKRKNDEE